MVLVKGRPFFPPSWVFGTTAKNRSFTLVFVLYGFVGDPSHVNELTRFAFALEFQFLKELFVTVIFRDFVFQVEGEIRPCLLSRQSDFEI